MADLRFGEQCRGLGKPLGRDVTPIDYPRRAMRTVRVRGLWSKGDGPIVTPTLPQPLAAGTSTLRCPMTSEGRSCTSSTRRFLAKSPRTTGRAVTRTHARPVQISSFVLRSIASRHEGRTLNPWPTSGPRHVLPPNQGNGAMTTCYLTVLCREVRHYVAIRHPQGPTTVKPPNHTPSTDFQ